MEHVTNGLGRTRGGPLSKLFRILVAGGIALGAGCETAKVGEKPAKQGDGNASAPPAQPAEPSGVRGW